MSQKSANMWMNISSLTYERKTENHKVWPFHASSRAILQASLLDSALQAKILCMPSPSLPLTERWSAFRR